MGKALPQQADAPGRVIDPSIAAARAERELREASQRRIESAEAERHVGGQAAAYASIVALVGRVEQLAGGRIPIQEERFLWFLLRCGPPSAWLPPADWTTHASLKGGEAVAHRTMVLAAELRNLDPGISPDDLYAAVMAAAPWQRRAGRRKGEAMGPSAWVFFLLLESLGAPAGPARLALTYDLAAFATGRPPRSRSFDGAKAQEMRQDLKPRDRALGEHRLAHARRMARAWYRSDPFGLERRIRARRGNPLDVAP